MAPPTTAVAQPTARTSGASSIDDLAKIVVETPRVWAGDISPDGASIIYAVTRDSVTKNETTTDLLVQRTRPARGAGEDTPVKIATGSGGRPEQFRAQWCPDSTCVTFFPQQKGASGPAPLMRYDLRTGSIMPIPIQDSHAGDRPRITTIGANYQWAPLGKLIAFVAPIEIVKSVKPAVGVRLDGRKNSLTIPAQGAKSGLFILDVDTGHVRQITPDNLSVSGFDWAPDSEAFAFTAISDGDSEDEDTGSDIFVVDRATGAVRDVVKQPGIDSVGQFSPDGRWLAVTSSFGKLSRKPGAWPEQLGIVSAAGGPLKGPAKGDAIDIAPSGGGELRWTADSRSFYYSNLSRMSTLLRRMTIEDIRTDPVAVAEDTTALNLRVSPDARSVAFVCSLPNVPDELCIRELPEGSVRRITRLSADFPLRSQVKSERVQWPSRDGGTTLHGLLLTPRSADSKGKALPTVVHVVGGPSMVRASFAADGHHEMLTLASHGYAVFIPNTRGRGWGYGAAYGFPDGHPDVLSYARVPYEDIMSGLDALVSRGVSDPDRLGLIGHSYGGYVASFTVTQTHRFRAAVNYEGISSNLASDHLERLPGSSVDVHNVKRAGGANPFEPEGRDKLLAATPAFNMHCVATPLMLVYGTGPNKDANAKPLFAGLQRLGIPGEMILYDDGHVVTLPTHKIDLAKRLAAWFDYWLQGKPYTDAKLQAEYDTWAKANAARRKEQSTPCEKELLALMEESKTNGKLPTAVK